MTRLGIVGSHARATASPPVWSRTFERLGLSWTYDPIEVEADGLDAVRHDLVSRSYTAVNVTMPHKGWAASVADVRSPDVECAQVANFLHSRAGRLEAANTDMVAVRALCADVDLSQVLILGAGGAAHGLLFALRESLGRVCVVDAVPGAAPTLVGEARAAGIDAAVADRSHVADLAGEATLMVNATPVGKPPDPSLPWGSGRLATGAVVYDFAYAAFAPTRAEQECARTGHRLINGWAHWYEQAAAMIPLLELPDRTAAMLRDSLCATQGAVIVAGRVPTRT